MISSAAMILVGLTGGVATGKSTVSKMFAQCGAVLIDADELARSAVQPGKPAWRAIVDKFGKGIVNPDRTINRHALGRMVFRNRQTRRQLERIVHPRVAREQGRLTREAARKDPHAVVIYDVPLLFEAGIDTRVDRILVVTADRDTQITRLQSRNGLARAEALQRIRSQMPISKKVQRADYVMDGTWPKRRLKAAVRALYRRLAAEA